VAYPFFITKRLARSGLARWLPFVRRRIDAAAYLHYYSDRVLAAPHAELHAAGLQLAGHGPDAIDLATGEPRFDVVPSGSTKLPADRRGYPPPWGLPELREAVADHLAADGSSEILITQGAAGAFNLAVDAFVNPGDRVVLFDPTSPLYPLTLRQRRAQIRWVPTWMENGRTRFHLGPLVQALKGARLLVVNSPANPTGGVIAPEDLEQLAWWADRHDVLIFNDEVFSHFQYEGQRGRLGELPKARGRTLTAGSVSKGYALAAARVGWLAGHRHLVRPCLLTGVLQNAFVPTLCQQIALAALRLGADVLRPIREEFASRRSYAFSRLQALGLKPAWPAGAFFLWVPVQGLGLSGRAFAEQLLKTKNVIVWPGDHFGPSGADYVRVSYAAEDGRLHQGLARLAEFVHERKAVQAELVRQVA
jgi:aspartate/methionine/tyrosine aminotransferase